MSNLFVILAFLGAAACAPVSALAGAGASAEVSSRITRARYVATLPGRVPRASLLDHSFLQLRGTPVTETEVEHISLDGVGPTGYVTKAIIGATVDASDFRCPATATVTFPALTSSDTVEVVLVSCYSPGAEYPNATDGTSNRRQSTVTVARGFRFHTLAEIEARIDAVVASFPAIAAVFTIGTSIEGSPIRAIRISTSPNRNDLTKQEIVMVGTHHAREWISAEVPMGIAEQLCLLYYLNARVRDAMQKVEFIIIPMVNPDGYAYSMGTRTARYWRKNRRLSADGSVGVDLNRNYPLYWGADEIGSSRDTSDDTYRGTSAGSEPETQVVMALMRNANFINALTYFVSYHNYGAELLWPYGDSDDDISPMDPYLEALSTHLARTLMPASPNGLTYNAYKASAPYPVNGDTVDWVHNTFDNVPAITIELRPGEGSCCGFDVQVAQINETIMENTAAVLFVAEYSIVSLAESSSTSGTATFSWWKRSPTSTFNSARVPTTDVNQNSNLDWFDRCAGDATKTQRLLTLVNAFPFNGLILWPATRLTTSVLRGDVCGDDAVNSYSVLSVGGTSVNLRLFLDLHSTTRGSDPLVALARSTTCLGLGTASTANSTLRANVERAIQAASVALQSSELTTWGVTLRSASWRFLGGLPTCGVEFQLTGFDPASVDRVYGALRQTTNQQVFTTDAVELRILPIDFDDVSAALGSSTVPPLPTTSGSTTPSPTSITSSPRPPTSAPTTLTLAPAPFYRPPPYYKGNVSSPFSASADLRGWSAAVISAVVLVMLLLADR
jgi:carboxypeptidase T